MLTTEKMHYSADVDRLYLPRAEEGRGLFQLDLTFRTTTMGLDTYLTSTEDPRRQLVKDHEDIKTLFSIEKEASKIQAGAELTRNTTKRK